MTNALRTFRPAAAASVIVVLLALAAFGRVLEGDFVLWDDPSYVTENPQVLRGLTAGGVRWAWSAFHSANWHPLTWISHMLDVELFGLRPWGHHLTSLLIHTLSAVLLLVTLRAMTGALLPSAFAAALFAVHPLHVQSVAWVSERKDVLSGLFWVLALAAYCAEVRRPSLRRRLATAAVFTLGLMAKPMLVTLPLVLLLLDYWPFGRLARPLRAGALLPLISEKLPLFLLAAASAAVTIAAQAGGGALIDLERLPAQARLWNAPLSYLRYLGKTLVPAGLSLHYPHPGREFPGWAGVLCFLALALLTARVLRASRGRGYPATGWLWFVLTLLPVIGIVQVGTQGIADRYTYLPHIGLFIIAAWAATEAVAARPARAPLVAAGAVVAVAALAALAWREAGLWRSSLRLAERAAAATGSSRYRALTGALLLREGRLEEAEPLLREAVLLRPEDPDNHYNLASLLARRGERGEAIEHYRIVLDATPDDAGAHLALGQLLSDEGMHEDGLRHIRAALEANPESPAGHGVAARVLERLGRSEEAAAHAGRAAAGWPSESAAPSRVRR